MAIISAIRKAFQCILQGVRILLANHTRVSPTSENDSYMPRPTLEHCAKQREIAWRIFRKIQIPAMEEIFFITWSLGRVYMLLGILPWSPLHRYCRRASETENMEIKDGLAVAADYFLVIGGLLGRGVRSYAQCGCNVLAEFWRLVGCSKRLDW